MKILEEVGLTKTEAEVYERLLQLGECSVSALQKSLASHPQVVYRTVESLTKKGLVISIRKKNKKFVSPEHPKKLEEIEKERLAKLRSALPELLHMMDPRKGTIVKTSIGFEAVKSLRRTAINELKRNDSLLIIGGSADRFYEAMGEDYKEIEDKRIKKKIHKKLIAFSPEKEKFKNDPHRLYTEFRYFSAFHPTTSSINIFGDNVGIIIWATEPILIHIKSSEVATSYRHYFEEMWASARS
jgi:sugar-specific transcriptional regulator TrmB